VELGGGGWMELGAWVMTDDNGSRGCEWRSGSRCRSFLEPTLATTPPPSTRAPPIWGLGGGSYWAQPKRMLRGRVSKSAYKITVVGVLYLGYRGMPVTAQPRNPAWDTSEGFQYRVGTAEVRFSGSGDIECLAH
jgi:hypothetical protein